MQKRIYERGQSFSRLTIIEPYFKKPGSAWLHKCLCACGNYHFAAGGDLKSGKVRSCGCKRKQGMTSHGMSKTSEYRVWAAMIQRCTNPNNSAYDNYGGRGISVCDSWNSFDCFIKDMGMKPDVGSTIERIDNNLGYCKENCRWDDRSTQALNTRLRKDNKTGFRGVSIKGSKFSASVQIKNKRVCLGVFNSPEEASQAINTYKEELKNG